MRIKKFLQQEIFKEEFSHTILHNKQVVFANPDNLSKPIMKQAEPSHSRQPSARNNDPPLEYHVKPKPLISDRRPSSQLQAEKQRPVPLRYRPPSIKESKHNQMVEDLRKKRAEEKEQPPKELMPNPLDDLIGQANEAVQVAVES